MVRALALLLGLELREDRTSSIRCLNADAHRNGDANPSLVVEPRVGRIVCRVCGLDAGLLQIGVLVGKRSTEREVAESLEQHFYGSRVDGASVTAGAGHVCTGGATDWPHYPKTAESLGWTVGRTPDGRRFLRVPTELLSGEPGRVKIRYEKAPDLRTATFEDSDLPIGLIVDDRIRDTISGEQRQTIALLAGETDLLAWVRHARDEGIPVAACSLATGEGAQLGRFATLFSDCHVVVVYDNDEAGRAEGPKRVRELLAAGAASAASIHVPDPYKDVCELLRAGGMVRDLLAQTESADTEPSDPTSSDGVSVPLPRSQCPRRGWRPFPVKTLPSPARELVTATAKAQGSDPALVAVPVLVAIAGAIGNAQSVVLKSRWQEPCVLWGVTVSESGTMKTPAFEAAMHPLRRRESEALRRHREEQKHYAARKARHDVEFAEWKRKKGSGPVPEVPEEPHAERLIVQDTTVEALAERLLHAPRGLLLAREEISGWFKSFNQYRHGKGGDESHWLSMYGAASITVDRKTGNPPTIHIERAAVSITGTIQPGVLSGLLDRERFESGLAARLLLACPPRTVKRWTEDSVPCEVLEAYDSLFGRLLELRPTNDEDGLQAAAVVHLSPEAKELFVEFYDRNAVRTHRSGGAEAALYSKIEGLAARLALVIYLVKLVTAEDYEFTLRIDAESMRAAIVLADWFADESLRVYERFYESEDERAVRELIEWLRRQRARATVALLARQGLRRYRGRQDDAKAALDALATAGLGSWQSIPPGPRGGRPTVEFVLADASATERGYVATEPKPPKSASDDGVPYPGGTGSGDEGIA